MAQPKKRWIIKGTSGHVRGPYSTQEVISQIKRGEVTGDEQIAIFPSNKWFPISQNPEFYDQLLSALENEDYYVDEESYEASVVAYKNEQNEIADQLTKETDPEPPEITEPIPAAEEQKPKKKNDGKFGRVERVKVKKEKKEKPKEDSVTEESVDKAEVSQKVKRFKKESESDDVIELKSKKEAVKSAKKKLTRTPKLIGVAAVVLLVAFFLIPTGKSSQYKFIYPKSDQAPLPKEQIVANLKLANKHIMQDTFSDYVSAQNFLIKAIEGNPRVAKGYSMLCIAYFELWPYTSQSASDIEVLTKLVKKTSKIDAAGMSFQICNAVNLYLNGQKQEAEGIIDMTLQNSDNLEEPPTYFYYLKAKIFSDNREYRAALNYVFSAQQNWNQWLRLFIFESRLKMKMQQYAAASQRLQEVLKVNPKHTTALILLGIIEHQYLKNSEKGIQLIKSGIKADALIDRQVLSEAYLILALNAIKNQSDSEALKYAKKGYSINPGSSQLRKIIISLGGDKELENTTVSSTYLVLEGDQFRRAGDCKAAQAYYKQAFEANEKNGLAAYKAGECLWKLSLRKDALLWLNKAVLSDPDLIDAYMLLSKYYADNYNFEEATKVLKRANQQFKKHFKIYRGFAYIELKRRNANSAIHFANKALNVYETDVESLIIMAKAYLALQNVKAYTSATKAIELESNNRDAQVVYAKTLMNAQGVQVGIDYSINLVNMYPRIEEYRIGLAEVLMLDQRYAQAERVLRDLILINDTYDGVHLLMAETLKGQQRYDEAAQSYNKAALLDPTNADSFFKSGIMYLEINKPKKAKVQLNRALQMNKLYPLVHYYLGLAALKMKLPKVALEHAQIERQKNPNLALPFILAADAHLMMKQYQYCVDEYRTAISFGKLAGDYYVKLARCAHLSGNLDMAEHMLNEAKKVESGNPNIYKELGAIFEKKKMPSHAVRAYEVYLKLAPNAEDAMIIQKRMNSL